ncbi:MAG TPA: hypothetical protein DCG34_11345 [Clostridiales bacterium]|nr:hypothetical protein [Clostridiales bacterium]
MGNLTKYVDYNRKLEAPDGTAIIINKLKQNNIEVNIYLLRKGHSFHLNPPSQKEGLKSYWVIRGKINSVEDQCCYGEGDLLTLVSNSDVVHITATEETELLVHSVNEPCYQTTINEFRYIHTLLEKIQMKDEYTFRHSRNVYEYI